MFETIDDVLVLLPEAEADNGKIVFLVGASALTRGLEAIVVEP